MNECADHISNRDNCLVIQAIKVSVFQLVELFAFESDANPNL